MNTNRMLDNMKTERMGVVPQIDITKDLMPKPKYNVDSWFAFGRFETEGHTFNYLFHIMAMNMGFLGTKYQSVVTLSDESTGYYYAKDYLFKPKEVTIKNDRFHLEMPNGSMSGDWDYMKLHINENSIILDTTVSAIHYPIISKGSSVFELLDMTIHQFSIPYMKTSGTLTLDGRTYDITDKGYTWFDRQWQNQNFKASVKWSWIAVYLDHGEVISILDCDVPGKEEGGLTLLRNDGSQFSSIDVPPFKSCESDYWVSNATNQKYPTKWHIPLSTIDAELQIESVIRDQEIASVMKQLNKYEGACTVTGTYSGKPITGHAVVELIGSWPNK